MFTSNNGKSTQNKDTYTKPMSPMSYTERRRLREQHNFDMPQHHSWLGEHFLEFELVATAVMFAFVIFAAMNGMFVSNH